MAYRLRVLMHEHAEGGRLYEQVQHTGDTEETEARHGLLVGIITGLVLGLIVGGGVFAWFFGATAGMVAAGAVLGALAGMAVGAIMSGIVGTGLTDRRLERLARGLRAGDVIVTFELPDKSSRESIESIIQRHGGRFEEKSAV